MSLKSALDVLKFDILHPHYLVYGEEAYLEDQFLKQLKLQLFQGEEDIEYFDLSQDDLAMVLDSANSYSFFSDWRLVIVDKVQFLSNQSKLKDSEQEILEDYLENPNPNTIIIWRLNGALDKRKKISKKFLSKAKVFELLDFSETEVGQFVAAEIKSRNLQMDRISFQILLERTDYQLTTCMQELEKLRLFSLGGKELTPEVIEFLVPRVMESNIFELTKAFMARDVAEASRIYEELILQKHQPIAILGLMIAQFRLIIQTAILSQVGYGQEDMAKQLGVHSYRIKLALEASRQYPLPPLLNLYQNLIESDYQLKTSQIDKDLFFYLNLFEFMEIKNKP